MCSTPNSLYVSKEFRRAGKGVGIFNLTVLAGHQDNRKPVRKITNHTRNHKCTHAHTGTERELSRVSRV